MDVSLYLYIVLIAGAFVLGAIPFGVISTWLLGLGDVRKIGSGNIGATNVLRTGSKLAASITLTGDLLKGFFAALLPFIVSLETDAFHLIQVAGIACFTSVAVVVGHCYSPFVGFRGGKGVATGIGVMIGFAALINLNFAFDVEARILYISFEAFSIYGWLPCITVLVVWLIIAVITRYSSLAAIVSFAVVPAVVWLVKGDTNLPLASLAISAIIIWRHRANITRLLNGNEAKIGD